MNDNGEFYTKNGIFDTVADHLGNKYALKDIRLDSPHPFNREYSTSNQIEGKGYSNSQTNSVPSQSCIAGYFQLFFSPGSFFDPLINPQALQAQATLCQLFGDMSNFINSTLPLTGPGAFKINILCGTVVGGAAGTASPIHVFPNNPNNADQGIHQNQIQKALISGQDPFLNLPLGILANSNSFYYGFVNAAFNPGGGNWNYNTSLTNIAPNELDFYTVMLHEVTHALGFYSLINFSGVSQFGVNNNYFSSFDSFLHHATSAGGTPLLTPGSAFCPNSSLSFNGPLSSINPAICPGPGPEITNCLTAPRYIGSAVVTLYRPDCWVAGSSISHFEDICTTPPGFSALPCTNTPPNNNLYYVMSNSGSFGSCYIKRHLTSEERLVLCDLGYSVKNIYTSTAANATYNYGGSACPGSNVWGVDDGITGTNYNFFTTLGSFALNCSTDVLINDALGAEVTCPEIIYGSGAALVALTGTFPNQILTVTETAGSGLVVVKYIPRIGNTLGNATYIYVYFTPGLCSPLNPCDLIQNGGFEDLTPTSVNCGGSIGVGTTLSCWRNGLNTPDLYSRNCGNWLNFDLGGNTQGMNYSGNPINSFVNFINTVANDRVAAIGAHPTMTPTPWTEVIVNNLSSPLIPNNNYQLSFWVNNYAGQSNSGAINQNNDTVVITFGSLQTFINPITAPFPAPALNILTHQKVACLGINPSLGGWQHITVNFTYTGTVNHSALFIGIDPVQTAAIGNYSSGTDVVYCYLDEVSLMLAPSPTMSLPPPSCHNSSIINLNQYASPIAGTFAGPGVTNTNGQFDFNSPPTLLPGTYPISFTYVTPGGCQKVLWQTVTVFAPSSVNLTITGPTSYCTTGPNSFITLSVAGNPAPPTGASIWWLPSTPWLTGPSISVNPLLTTVYTAHVNYITCTAIQTFTVVNTCCPQTNIPVITSSNLSNTLITGPRIINHNITIGGSPGSVTFKSGEFLIAKDVLITVLPGHQLNLAGIHIYACGNDMWDGIKVLDGASLKAYMDVAPNLSGDNSTMIEDAKVAINLSNIVNPVSPTPIDLQSTIFNKNYISIKIDSSGLATIPIHMTGNVITCRTITFNPNTWPNSNAFGGGLRTAINPTIGLQSPYQVQIYPVSNLKAPYNTHSAYSGIEINNIANSPGLSSNGVVITDLMGIPSAGNFNLFDALGTGINVLNSSLSTMNNVFQNAIQYQTTGGYWLNGQGIIARTTSLMNAKLNLEPNTGLTSSESNRFWNCQGGIIAYDIFEFNIKNSIFRSTQVTSGINSFATSCGGIYINTNRFNYSIIDNEFNNIKNAIYMRTNNDPYTFGAAVQNGVFASTCDIKHNYFGPEVISTPGLPSGNAYLNEAITLYGPNVFSWSQNGNGVAIESNKIDRAFQGISVTEFGGTPISIRGNLINLIDDNTLFSLQRGVEVIRTQNNVAVESNTISGTQNPYNPNMTLVYCEDNIGNGSPIVSCNELSDSYQAFEFRLPNWGTIWMGNKMMNHERGLSLTNNGIINHQGNPGMSCANEWNGTWMPPTNHHTYVDGSSNAINSPLFLDGANPSQMAVSHTGGPSDYNQPGTIDLNAPSVFICHPNNLPAPPSNRNGSAGQTFNSSFSEDFMVNVYPNPSSGDINIMSQKENEVLNLRIIDISGKVVYNSKIITSGYTKNLNLNLEGGLYIIEINDETNHQLIKKLIIAK